MDKQNRLDVRQTDSARVDQELIYVYCCKLGVIKIKFLVIESVEKAYAATIFDAVVSGFLTSVDIDEPTLYNTLIVLQMMVQLY